MSIKQILIITLLSVCFGFSGSSAPWTELFGGSDGSNATTLRSNVAPRAPAPETVAPDVLDSTIVGPLFSRFPLTLAVGERKEFVSPFFYEQQSGSQTWWGIPPFAAGIEDSETDSGEVSFLYPMVTEYHFGNETRRQFFQLFGEATSMSPSNSLERRFTFFPFYFQQRSTDPSKDYTAVFPLYGHLRNRLFRDEIDFVAWPFYVRTRKKDVVSYDTPYPFYSRYSGNGLRGWQLWPFYGHEHKEITMKTNVLHEAVVDGGRDSKFINWPFYMKITNGIGTTNLSTQFILIPFRTSFHSTLRDSESWGWPIGVTRTVDREKKYSEWDTPWPIIEFAKGEGKNAKRIFPFYSNARNATHQDKWVCWPVYKVNRINSPPLLRERTRICFFLYSDLQMKSTETGRHLRHVDFFPFYTYRRDMDGRERLQVLAIMEPFFPNNAKIEREYSPVYSLWRAEKNPLNGVESQSLLWNLYRRDTSPQAKKISLLFGLLQYQSTPKGSNWRVCYIPVGGRDQARTPASVK